MRSRVTRRWVGYLVLLVVALLAAVVTAIGRMRLSSSGPTELVIGSIVLGALVVAAVVGVPLWRLPSARLARSFRARHPDAVVDTGMRDDFRALIDVDALELAYRDLPYWVTLVADQAGIAVWIAGDPGIPERLVATIPWSRLGELELSETNDALPRYVVEVAVEDTPGESLRMTIGGVLPRSYGRSQRTLEALRAVRSGADSGVR